MAQEENDADSLSNRSKKVKQKKVPQRGLGVAQLERIRLEDEKKREALQAANFLATTELSVQCHSFPRPSLNLSPNTVPMFPPSPNNPSPNILFRPTPSIPTVEIMNQSSVQISKHVNGGGGGEMGILGLGNGNWPRIRNGEYSLDGWKNGLDHQGFVFHGQVNLQYDANSHPLPITIVPQRSHQFHQDSSFSSSMVNASSRISPSSVLNSQMEPPSNQTFHGSNNNRSSLLTEEDKMVGIKRSYPFSLESPAAPSFNGNSHPTYAASKSRLDELVSCTNGPISHIDPRKQYIREGPSHSSPLPPSDVVVVGDDGRLDGDFLTLAPPTPSYPRDKNPMDFSGRQLLDSQCLSGQENSKSKLQWLMAPRESKEQTFSFFVVGSQVENSTVNVSNGKEETIDLRLKL